MDALECIHTRRSVRKYTDEPVSPEDIREMLSAAMTAPSACKQFPWHFVLVTDPAKLKAVKAFSPHAGMAARAPLAVLVCADTALETRCPGYWVQDCAAAVENLLLAARALGLGAVWTGSYPREDRVEGFRALLDIPENVVPMAFLVVGHPAEPQERADRFLADRVHENSW